MWTCAESRFFPEILQHAIHANPLTGIMKHPNFASFYILEVWQFIVKQASPKHPRPAQPTLDWRNRVRYSFSFLPISRGSIHLRALKPSALRRAGLRPALD